MEFECLEHPSYMKHLLILSFIFTIQWSFAQDTLREINSVMYGRYYILKEDGQFEFHFNHCTGQTLAFGKYKKRKSSILFEYDSIPEPNTKITGLEDVINDTIKIRLFNIIDSAKIEFFEINYGNQKWTAFDGTGLIPKSNLNQDSIQIKYFNQTINVSVDNDYSIVNIYVFPPYISYVSSGISKLKRKNNFYYHKIKFRDINEDKPWRKGKLQKITYKYKIK